ncbi:MAG: hypothetical protein HY835_00770 [Anaerolineae bacterium]|nr:hypothetical protein [Anaerolineae bacterium]
MNWSEITLLGWCGIGAILFIFVSINIWLIGLLRRPPQALKRPDPNRSAVKQVWDAVRNPYAREDSQLSELSKRVEKFKKDD